MDGGLNLLHQLLCRLESGPHDQCLSTFRLCATRLALLLMAPGILTVGICCLGSLAHLLLQTHSTLMGRVEAQDGRALAFSRGEVLAVERLSRCLAVGICLAAKLLLAVLRCRCSLCSRFFRFFFKALCFLLRPHSGSHIVELAWQCASFGVPAHAAHIPTTAGAAPVTHKPVLFATYVTAPPKGRLSLHKRMLVIRRSVVRRRSHQTLAIAHVALFAATLWGAGVIEAAFAFALRAGRQRFVNDALACTGAAVLAAVLWGAPIVEAAFALADDTHRQGAQVDHALARTGAAVLAAALWVAEGVEAAFALADDTHREARINFAFARTGAAVLAAALCPAEGVEAACAFADGAVHWCLLLLAVPTFVPTAVTAASAAPAAAAVPAVAVPPFAVVGIIRLLAVRRSSHRRPRGPVRIIVPVRRALEVARVLLQELVGLALVREASGAELKAPRGGLLESTLSRLHVVAGAERPDLVGEVAQLASSVVHYGYLCEMKIAGGGGRVVGVVAGASTAAAHRKPPAGVEESLRVEHDDVQAGRRGRRHKLPRRAPLLGLKWVVREGRSMELATE